MADHALVPRRRVLIVGGSLAGLLAGNLFHRMGWDVEVFERTAGALDGRGAGITILPGLVETFEAAGVSEKAYGVELSTRIALDRSGRIVAQRPFSQVMTSWRRLYDLLGSVFPQDRYHSGVAVQRIEQSADKVTAYFSSGESMDAELLVGADGSRSTVRGQFLPDLKPHYPGYIAWRCLVDEADLCADARAALLERYAICLAPGEQGIGYVVPGPDHSMEPGKRQCNVVWYHPVREIDELPRLLTDDTGCYHANGIPPSLIPARVRQEMMDLAEKVLAPQFAAAIRRARLVFFQPIVDLESPRMVFGRAVIIGDAAFVARPHVAMGVPKAGADALALADAVKHSGSDYLDGLQAFEGKRLRVGAAIVARGRYLGSYMEAQLKSEIDRKRAEELRVPEQAMMEMAAPLDFS